MAFDYDALHALTLDYYYNDLIDQIGTNDPIIKMLMKKKRTVDGGKKFTFPVKVDHVNSGTYGPNQTFPNTDLDIENIVSVDTGGYFVEVVDDGFLSAQNAGSRAIRNLLEDKLKDMRETMEMKLREGLYGTKVAGGFTGLSEIIDDNNTLYGLDRTKPEHAYFKSQIVEDAVNGIDLVGDAGYQALRRFHTNVTQGGKFSNIVYVCDYETHNLIEFLLASRNQISTVNQTQANLGFTDFSIFGKPVLVSDDLQKMAQTSGKGALKALNMDELEIATLSHRDFYLTPWKDAQNNDKRVQQLLVQGNYVCKLPKSFGEIRDIKIS